MIKNTKIFRFNARVGFELKLFYLIFNRRDYFNIKLLKIIYRMMTWREILIFSLNDFFLLVPEP